MTSLPTLRVASQPVTHCTECNNTGRVPDPFNPPFTMSCQCQDQDELVIIRESREEFAERAIRFCLAQAETSTQLAGQESSREARLMATAAAGAFRHVAAWLLACR